MTLTENTKVVLSTAKSISIAIALVGSAFLFGTAYSNYGNRISNTELADQVLKETQTKQQQEINILKESFYQIKANGEANQKIMTEFFEFVKKNLNK